MRYMGSRFYILLNVTWLPTMEWQKLVRSNPKNRNKTLINKIKTHPLDKRLPKKMLIKKIINPYVLGPVIRPPNIQRIFHKFNTR
jgi:hypothetical protein